jgi:methylated-DNA-[protein]-cysteine S-methyltransferase
MTMRLLVDRMTSPVGPLTLASDGRALIAIEFGDEDHRLHPMLTKRFGALPDLIDADDPQGFTSAMRAYFDGELNVIDTLPVDGGGTDFQKRVWVALRDIPCGATESYGGLATRLGMRNSMRAVGLANGANPISVVVPCHRVIGANGSLTGYGGGIERKRWLLAHEGALPGSAQGEMAV